jgi:protein TonB
VAAKPVVKKPVTQSKGVVNGFAIDLPKPVYSPVARAMNLGGVVNVQVLIDEAGNVVSAKAVDGHILFRPEAERAARRAKFKPTLLSDQPVKVTGVIVYSFKKA